MAVSSQNGEITILLGEELVLKLEPLITEVTDFGF